MEKLFEDYKNLIYSLSFKLTGQQEAADNLFQETWLRAVRSYHQLNPEKSPRNWLYTICLNCYRELYNSKKRKDHYTQQYSSEDRQSFELDRQQDAGVESAEQQLLRTEREEYLRQVIANINPLYKMPITLFYYEELSYLEISELMEIPLSTVKYRMFQGKKQIKEKMEEYDGRG